METAVSSLQIYTTRSPKGAPHLGDSLRTLSTSDEWHQRTKARNLQPTGGSTGAQLAYAHGPYVPLCAACLGQIPTLNLLSHYLGGGEDTSSLQSVLDRVAEVLVPRRLIGVALFVAMALLPEECLTGRWS